MNEAQFWEIIETAHREAGGDQDRQYELVARQLRALPAPELIEFERIYTQKIVDAQHWDLRGAAYLINGGCSDDGFVYFRAWLVAQGEQAYLRAVERPDSLAAVVDPERDDYEFELLWNVSRDVYEEVVGEDMPPGTVDWPSNVAGERWDFDDDEELLERFPNLARLYQ